MQALPKVISLFSGAGGLDLGFKDAGFEVAFALDISDWAIETHRRNFPATFSVAADLIELGPTGLLELLVDVVEPGSRICVIGGPPCQGFSRANVTSFADDPRNALPLLYLEVVELLMETYTVEFVLFENVLGIRDQKHKARFEGILSKLRDLDFKEGVEVHCAADYGVPQVRNRVIISGFKDKAVAERFFPKKVEGSPRTVRQTISHLPEPAYYSRGIKTQDIPHHPNHWTMRPKSQRFREPYQANMKARSFRRLWWDKPSPTVAYGHREIHVHPVGNRRLSIYEAMLLQGFPHSFTLVGPLSAQVEQVSNAVPPPLAAALATAIRAAMEQKAVPK